MMKQLPATGMVCSQYEKLLEESTAAKDAWSKFRVETCWAHFIPKEAVDKLLRLQAKYARANTLLQKHVHTCLQCEPASRIA